jgi:hypothetical protein
MADPDIFAITAMKASRGLAVKVRELAPDGSIIKGDHTLLEKWWLMKVLECPNDAGHVADLLRPWLTRFDVMTVHGTPAPGLNLARRHPRWSSEGRGADATLISPEVTFIPFDGDKFEFPEGSTIGEGQNIVGQAEYFREEFLPPAFRDVELVVRASSSTGLSLERGSLHIYALFKGGLADPVPEDWRVFRLPGFRPYATNINWNEFEPDLTAYKSTERRAHVVGGAEGWRGVLERYLGDGPGQLRFFAAASIAMGFAARSNEPVEEVAAAMNSIIVAHPDCDGERRVRWATYRLRNEIQHLRDVDSKRMARTNEIRRRLVAPTAETSG